jgi:1-deoxy-D-xylulose-5-phosphate reductoisomerase
VQGLSILGSTGSVGTQTLDIVRLFPERFRVHALTAHSNVDLLAAQAREFRPQCVVMAVAEAAIVLRHRLEDMEIEVLAGPAGLCTAATLTDVHTIVAAMVGFAGLESVLAALRAKKKVALANKETLVVAGAIVERVLAEHGGVIIPVDSEHSAIFQCLVGESRSEIDELVLTASGGPFRTRNASTFGSITREEALEHPNWSMGAKITIDSATMMNKGLEVIEAHWLFGIDVDRISVLVHPQSIVHSMVSFTDGSTKAQLGIPDMKVPIQYALSYPDRWPAPNPRLDWTEIRRLDFEQPDVEKFPCLSLAYAALHAGGSAPAVLNAANEAAVSLFLNGRIRFTDIPFLIGAALESEAVGAAETLDDLIAIDKQTRSFVVEHTRVGAI